MRHRKGRRVEPAAPPVAPAPRSHPAWLAAAAVAALCVALSASFRIYEKDFWQHLAVGRAIWTLHHVPTTQLWTWPTYGAPDVNSSWGFRALLWPVWQAGGVVGLFAWRWATTLAVFGLALATARRMGARGFTPLVVMVLCSLTYRQRSQLRPETLASVWLALSIWLLETRRAASPATRPRLDRAFAMVPLIWAWVNSHISHPLGLALLGAHALDATLARRRPAGSAAPGAKRGASALWLAGAAALALAFVNPFGWRAVTQPFEYLIGQRHEPIFQVVPELRPLDLRQNLRNLLPLVLFGWPLLAGWRWRRRGRDLVEASLIALFLPLGFASQRFLGFAMVAAAPYLARDLDEWVGARRWPAWTASAWSRAGLAASTCVLVGVAEWRRPDLPLGVGIRWSEYPVAACDFMEREGVRGHGFNEFFLGGYLLHRFWPDPGRLPFMDIHQTGTREDRDTYAFALTDERAWRDLDRRRRFDYALLRRVPYAGGRLIDFLDADSSFAIVFMDDAAALYARRDGPLAVLAARLAYREVPAGTGRLGVLGSAVLADPARRARVTAELEREAAGSRFDALALGRLGSLELATGDRARARAHLLAALAVDPRSPRAHERLGWIALASGDPRGALREFEDERRMNGRFPRYDLGVAEARDSLASFGRGR